MDAELTEMLASTVQIAPWVSDGFTGSGAYGDLVTYPARYVGKVMSQRLTGLLPGDGEQVLPIFDIYVDAPGVVLSPRDKVVPVDDFKPKADTVKVVVFTVTKVQDETGEVYYQKLSCGWQYHRQGQL